MKYSKTPRNCQQSRVSAFLGIPGNCQLGIIGGLDLQLCDSVKLQYHYRHTKYT